MIKKLFFIALLFPFFMAFAQEEVGNYTIIYPGAGLGDIKLDKSSISDVETVYGKKYKKDKKVFSEYYAKSKTYITITYFKMIYKKQGLVFFFTQKEGEDQEKLTDIEISLPFKGKTKNGIILGQSTFADVMAKEGQTSWTYSIQNKRVSKIYDGILYSSTVKGKIPKFDSKLYNDLYRGNVIDFTKISSTQKD